MRVQTKALLDCYFAGCGCCFNESYSNHSHSMKISSRISPTKAIRARLILVLPSAKVELHIRINGMKTNAQTLCHVPIPFNILSLTPLLLSLLCNALVPRVFTLC